MKDANKEEDNINPDDVSLYSIPQRLDPPCCVNLQNRVTFISTMKLIILLIVMNVIHDESAQIHVCLEAVAHTNAVLHRYKRGPFNVRYPHVSLVIEAKLDDGKYDTMLSISS